MCMTDMLYDVNTALSKLIAVFYERVWLGVVLVLVVAVLKRITRSVILPLIGEMILRQYSISNAKIENGTGSLTTGQTTIAYKFVETAYGIDDKDNAGPLFSQAAMLAPENKRLEIHYSEYDIFKAEEPRHVMGYILAEGEQVNEELVKEFETQGFKFFQLPEVESVVRFTLPNTTMFSYDGVMGEFYSKMRDCIQEYGLYDHPFVVVFNGKTMDLMVPLSRMEDFYVPEAQQHLEELYGSSQSDEWTESDTSGSISDDSETESSVLDSSEEQWEDNSQEAESEGSQETNPESKISQDAEPASASVPDQEEEKSDDDSSSFEIL